MYSFKIFNLIIIYRKSIASRVIQVLPFRKSHDIAQFGDLTANSSKSALLHFLPTKRFSMR